MPPAGAVDGELVRWALGCVDASGKPPAIDGPNRFVIRGGAVATGFVAFDRLQFACRIGLPADRPRGDRATEATRRRLSGRVRDRRLR